MQHTQPVDWLEKPFQGYVVNTVFSDENTNTLADIAEAISREFPGAFYPMPKHSLHVTLFDWIAPLLDYDGRDKTALYERIFNQYDQILEEILSRTGQITVDFDEIVVAPTTIFIKGTDDGSFQKIRDEFLDRVDLLEGTKLPPQIIHSSLGRFTKEIPVADVQDFISKYKIGFSQKFDNFRLVHTKKEPMLEYKILKKYVLA